MENNILHVLKNTYRRPLNIKGRSNRKEHNIFLLSFFSIFYFLYFLVLQKIHFIIPVITFLFLTVSAIIGFCLTIRRLHDINFSSYWILITIPLLIIGFIVEIKTSNSIFFEFIIVYLTIQSLLLCLLKGTEGINKYGPPPEY